MTSAHAAPAGWLPWLADLLRHLPLPALALGLPLAATLERVQSQAVAEALAEPCMTAARARGVSERQVLWRHAVKLGAKPVAAMAGLLGGMLLSGSFAVELVTSWPGLGRLTYDALRARDLYLAAGCVSAAAGFLVVGLLASDLALAALDPRITPRSARPLPPVVTT
jgi:peptide/nickel transport system permease protein